jgi:hypothetical protein
MQHAKMIHRTSDPHLPSVPKIRLPELGAIEPELLAALKPWQQALDQFATHARPGGDQTVLDFKLHFGLLSRLTSSALTLRWPKDLFIPGTADWKQYWFFPPPASQRYGSQWTSGAPNMANFTTGQCWAYGAVGVGNPTLHTEAGVGFLFTPPHQLATYAIAPTLSLAGNYRWNTATTADASGTITEWGGVYTAAWDVSPVDGSLTLVQPYGVATLYNEQFEGQGTTAITPVASNWVGGPATANIMLQGAHTYLIGVVAAVEIHNGWTDNQGHPVTQLPPGSTFTVWCDLSLTVPSVSVDADVIYIP